MLIFTLCCISLYITLTSGSTPSDQIFQTPFEIFKTPGETAEISCSHSLQNYDRILWYKQSEHEIQLLGYVVGSSRFPEKGLNVEIKGSADIKQTCTLTVKDLSVSSSAVYFCAASYHSAAYHCSSVQKPP
ncbi:hypothetical protein GOODEAATRI_032978 [Goodea atripinnis]|uniref:Ig-like domain-containing protein n=1 Tax=Goodea atripinnis TaxID=208336 RepID=A0ABV0P9S6_9TELE